MYHKTFEFGAGLNIPALQEMLAKMLFCTNKTTWREHIPSSLIVYSASWTRHNDNSITADITIGGSPSPIVLFNALNGRRETIEVYESVDFNDYPIGKEIEE
jgi:hypothetical protein